jgi:Fe-S oxidoreductase/nitrate reductase gamma subunit
LEHGAQLVFDLRFFFILIIATVCTAYAAKSFYRVYRIMTLGSSESLWDQLSVRLKIFTNNVLLQKKMFKDLGPAIGHSCIFFGFIIVTIGSGEHIIEGFLHGFSFQPFLGSLYGPIIVLQDYFQWVVVIGVLYFLYRRLIQKPTRMSHEWRHQRDGLTVLFFTGLHMAANILAFILLTHAGDPHAFAEHRPVSSFLAAGLAGMDVELASQLGWIAWAVHVGTVFVFLTYIPHSKHLHVFTAGPNIFFARLGARGALSTINFEDETQTSFGVSKVTEFSWKDILDAYSCTACTRCNEFCPTATTGKPLKPMKLIEDIKLYANNHGDALLANKDADVPALISEETGLSYDTVWACTTCGACVEACPVMIEHVDKIVDMRRSLVLMEGKMPQELQNTFTNWERQSNPWGMPADARDAWAQELNVARLADKPDAEFLFYVGCAGSFNDRNKKISTALVKILQKAGIDFAILGKEELCNGETARRAGNEYLAKTMIDANIEVLKKYNVKKVIASCPHCFNTLKNEYPDFGFQPESVQHHTEFINQLIQEGKIKVEAKKDSLRIAFHDSCYLGRYNEVYEEPRDTLKAIGGVEIVEMPRNRSKGLCCGAGGARMWMEETIGKRINVERVQEALEQKPDMIAAGCPFCQVMLEDGIKTENKQDSVPVRDIAEIIAEQIS